MSNIREVQFTKPDPNGDVITMLEDWLERARKGDVQAIGIVGVKPGGIASTEWVGLANGGIHELISGLSILQYRVIASNVEVD